MWRAPLERIEIGKYSASRLADAREHQWRRYLAARNNPGIALKLAICRRREALKRRVMTRSRSRRHRS